MAHLLAALPVRLDGRADAGAMPDAFGEAGEVAFGVEGGPGGEFHELEVVRVGEGDLVVVEEGGGVVAEVEEHFGVGGGFEEGF